MSFNGYWDWCATWSAHRFLAVQACFQLITTAVLIPNSLNELLVGGTVNSALVPVFSDYAEPENRDELWGIVSTFLSIAVVILLLLIVVVELFTPQTALLVGAYNLTDVTLTDTSVGLMRLATPAVLFMSVASVLTGVLFALKRFTVPAFVGTIFNATIIIVALLRSDTITSLVYGMLLGSFLQVVVQLYALRDARFRPSFNWRHPALRRIIWLYLPVLASIGISQLSIGFAYNLANRTGDQSLTYMNLATRLYQFPFGLVVTALSFATLPTLSRQASGQLDAFRQTLAEGIRLVMTLVFPAAAGLFAMALPVIMLIFERGQFSHADAVETAKVLRVFMVGLPFAAVDQMLIFASYARKDTWRPALVGVVSIIVYSIFAWVMLPRLGLLSLIWADAVKHMTHTALMLWLLKRHLGGLPGYGVIPTLFKAALGAVLMGVVSFYLVTFLLELFGSTNTIALLVSVGVTGVVGLLLYAGIARLLKIREIDALLQLVRRSSPKTDSTQRRGGRRDS